MREMTREMFRAWSKNRTFKKRLTNTIEQITNWFATYKNINASVSGGKDSLVMLDLLLKQSPNIHVWHWDYGIYMPRPYQKEVESILKEHFQIKNLRIDRRTSKDPASSTGYKSFFYCINKHILTHFIELNFIGLRKEESCKRRQRCKTFLEPVNIKGYHYHNVFPLKDWTWRDIWAYIIANNIPYPSSYDKRGDFLGWDQVRFVTFFDKEFEHLGGPIQDKFFFWKEREIS